MKEKDYTTIKIYVDGSCRGNGTENSSGGYGLAIYKGTSAFDGHDMYSITTVLCDEGEPTTNNREEMKGLIEALRLAVDDFEPREVEIYSDSAYCVNMFNEWIYTWARNGWYNSKNVTVENLDLVLQLYDYASMEFPNFWVRKIRGHSGEIGNELADAAATNNLAKLEKLEKEFNISIVC